MEITAVRNIFPLIILLTFVLFIGWGLVGLVVVIDLLPKILLIVPLFFTVLLVPMIFAMRGQKIRLTDEGLETVERNGRVTIQIPVNQITDINGYLPAVGVNISKQRINIRNKGVESIYFDLFLYRKKDVQKILDEIQRRNINIRYHER